MKSVKKWILFSSLMLSFLISSQVFASEKVNYDLVSFIFRVYHTCSIDTVSGDDIHYTYEKLKTKKLTAIDMLCDAFNSVEYRSKNTTDKEFIYDVYHSVFNKDPDIRYVNKILSIMPDWSRESIIKEMITGPEFYDMCATYDIHMIKDMDHPVMQYAKAVMDELNWDLRSAFEWSFTEVYYEWPYTPGYADSHLEFYGKFGFENHYGNCYVMASVFCWMARLKGMNIYTVEGYVPTGGGVLSEHGWCEAIIDGKTYVFDASWSRHGNDGFMIQYRQKGTYMYTDYKRVY